MSNPQSQYRQHRCDIRGCRRFFDGKVGLKDHLERDHEGRLICAVESCNTSFTRIQDMRRHVHNLHEDGKEKCPHCSSQMRKDKMKAHKEICAPPTDDVAIANKMADYDGGQFTSKVSLYLSEGAAQTAVSSDGFPNDSQRGAPIDSTTEPGYYYEQYEQIESWVTPHINSYTVAVQGHEQGGMRLGYNDCLQEEKEICEETSDASNFFF